MDFFSKITKKAKETYKEASQKTGELAKEAKLRMKMNENKSTINTLYQEIGKKVYEKHSNSETIDIKKEDLEEECTKIDILSAEIESCLKQIRELKDKKQCPKCFKEIELSAKFCNYCGAEQEDTSAKEVEVLYNGETETTNNEEIKVEEIQKEVIVEEDIVSEETAEATQNDESVSEPEEENKNVENN